MTSKRKNAPIFAAQYLDGLKRVAEGNARHPQNPFDPTGAAFKIIVMARGRALQYADECSVAKTGTHLWYCKQIAALAEEFEAAQREKRIRDALGDAFVLGMLAREFSVQQTHGTAIDTHTKKLTGLQRPNAERRSQTDIRDRPMHDLAKSLWRDNPDLKDKEVCAFRRSPDSGWG